MSWYELTGKRVRVGSDVGQVVHVDLLRVVLMTEPQDGVPSRRLVVSQDDGVDIEVLDDEGAD